MADLEDMEMLRCPHCGKEAPKDFFPLCSCEHEVKAGKKPRRKSGKAVKDEKDEDPYDFDY